MTTNFVANLPYYHRDKFCQLVELKEVKGKPLSRIFMLKSIKEERAPNGHL